MSLHEVSNRLGIKLFSGQHLEKDAPAGLAVHR
jgi:hypothetical protein